jgi:hypothetical protein
MFKPMFLALTIGTVTSCATVIDSASQQTVNYGGITFTASSVTALQADGPAGKDTYKLIRNAFGSNSIESPSLYKNNHHTAEHLWEETDSVVGHHFVFAVHRDEDWDRDKYPKISDRQRNEIKTYGSSSDKVKGFYGETLRIRWQFKITEGMEVSKYFSHFFQLKAVGDDASHPIVTLTGREKSGSDVIEIRHAQSSKDTYLDTNSWDAGTGQWLQADCIATFMDDGYFRLTVTSLDGTEVILSTEQENIDMWRSSSKNDSSQFVRPKWGIYRSIKQSSNLRSDEEIVRFANFEISKGVLEE